MLFVQDPATPPTSYVYIAVYLIFFYLSTSILIAINYIHMKAQLSAFNNSNLRSTSAVKISNFVGRLLPTHIKNSLGSDDLIGETADDVTLLFADIVGFTSYSAGKPR